MKTHINEQFELIVSACDYQTGCNEIIVILYITRLIILILSLELTLKTTSGSKGQFTVIKVIFF